MTVKKTSFGVAIVMYLLAALFLFYEMAIQVSPSIMTRQLMHDFSITSAGLGVMAAFYFYSYTAMQIPAGLLYDRYGPKTLLTIASIVCALGALFFGLTTTVFWAAIGRFLMGIGSAFAFIGVLVVAARWFEGYYFACLVGVAQLLAALGAISGEVPLAWSVEQIGWRNTMFFLVGVGFILAFLCFFILQDRPKHECKNIMPKERSFWRHIGLILQNVQTWIFALYAFVGWGPMSVFASLWGVPFLMVRYQIDAFHAALPVTMMWLGIGLTAPFVGWISNLIGLRKPILWIGSLVGLISSVILVYPFDIPYWATFILLFFMGFACAAHILTFALVRDVNKPNVVATAVGVNNMAVVIGGAILQPLVGGILTSLWDGKTLANGVPVHNLADYHWALSIVPILYLIGFATAIFAVQETHCHNVFEKK